jgi:hypothetical protein
MALDQLAKRPLVVAKRSRDELRIEGLGHPLAPVYMTGPPGRSFHLFWPRSKKNN